MRSLFRITFLLPVASPAPQLQETLDSLNAQTFEAWAVVLIADGPAHNEVELAKSVIAANRLTICHTGVKSGIANALNHGLTYVNSEYVARIDADDRCSPERLARQVAALDDLQKSEQPTVATGSSARLINEHGETIGHRRLTTSDDIRRDLIYRNVVVHSSATVRTTALRAVGGYDTRCKLREDYDLWLRLGLLGKIAVDGHCLVDYRITPTQSSRGATNKETIDLVAASRSELAAHLRVGPAALFSAHTAWRARQWIPVQSVLNGARRFLRGRRSQ